MDHTVNDGFRWMLAVLSALLVTGAVVMIARAAVLF